jgi:predicted esterase
MRRLIGSIALIAAWRLAAQERGVLLENVATLSDPTQTYTLYLPKAYDATRKVPLLYVLDPRGRATVAAELFRAGAEEHGWIVISSNQTRSDTIVDVNERALRALMPEAKRYASDPRRIYLAGFSGTAIVATAVGVATGAVAGVIDVGGRLVPQVPPAKYSFAHYGLSGTTDFNNREMRQIDAILEQEGKPHRFQSFEGDHSWMPLELAAEAIGWMELMAMKDGRRPRDAALVERLYAHDVAGAQALEASGHRVNALQRYRDIARTFDGLRPIDEPRGSATRLSADPNVRRELAEIAKWDDFEARYASEIFARVPSVLAEMREADRPPTTSYLLRHYRVADLKRRAAGEGAEGLAARRLLASTYGQTSFYLMRDLMDKRDYALAAAVIGVAADIHPERSSVWYNLGAAHARAGDRRAALAALEKAISLGFRDREQLLADEDFASLRADKRFQGLLASRSQ